MEVFKGLIYNDIDYSKDFNISNTGILYSLRTNRIIKTYINHKGYYQVCISFSRKNKKIFKIHRAVACTFLDKIDGKNLVNHKDGNKLNNHIDNLEWCTQKENIIHAYEYRLMKPNYYPSTCSKVMCIELNKNFLSLGEAARFINGNAYHISQCCRGIRKTHKKLHWKFNI